MAPRNVNKIILAGMRYNAPSALQEGWPDLCSLVSLDPDWANQRSALCGRPCEFSLHASCACLGEGIVHARGGNGLHDFADDVFL